MEGFVCTGLAMPWKFADSDPRLVADTRIAVLNGALWAALIAAAWTLLHG